MKLKFDLEFFPALRETLSHPDLEQLRYRNYLRLVLAKATDGNIFRPKERKDECKSRVS